MMKLDDLKKLYVLGLKDLYSAENQIIEALPKMIGKATNPDLQTALRDHLAVTREHKGRLERVFEELDFEPAGHRCKAMEAILSEGEETLEQTTDPAVRDAAIIAGAQRVEHYEISGYGTAATYANQMGDNEAAGLLQRTLKEEEGADRLLSSIAKREVNALAIP